MKKLLALLGAAGVIVSAGAVVVSCGGPDAPTEETPSDKIDIDLSSTTANVVVGGSIEITIDNFTELEEVVVTSGNENISTFTHDGNKITITGVSTGENILTVKANNANDAVINISITAEPLKDINVEALTDELKAAVTDKKMTEALEVLKTYSVTTEGVKSISASKVAETTVDVKIVNESGFNKIESIKLTVTPDDKEVKLGALKTEIEVAYTDLTIDEAVEKLNNNFQATTEGVESISASKKTDTDIEITVVVKPGYKEVDSFTMNIAEKNINAPKLREELDTLIRDLQMTAALEALNNNFTSVTAGVESISAVAKGEVKITVTITVESGYADATPMDLDVKADDKTVNVTDLTKEINDKVADKKMTAALEALNNNFTSATAGVESISAVAKGETEIVVTVIVTTGYLPVESITVNVTADDTQLVDKDVQGALDGVADGKQQSAAIDALKAKKDYTGFDVKTAVAKGETEITVTIAAKAGFVSAKTEFTVAALKDDTQLADEDVQNALNAVADEKQQSAAIDALKAKKDYTGFDVKTAVADGETNITVTIEAKDGFTTITTEFTVVAEKDDTQLADEDVQNALNAVADGKQQSAAIDALKAKKDYTGFDVKTAVADGETNITVTIEAKDGFTTITTEFTVVAEKDDTQLADEDVQNALNAVADGKQQSAAIDALKAKKDYTGFDVKTAVADGETNITVTIEAKDGFTTITTEFTVVAEKDDTQLADEDVQNALNAVADGKQQSAAIDALKAKKDYTGFDVKTAVADGETNITVTIEAKDGFTTITTEFTVVAEKDDTQLADEDVQNALNAVADGKQQSAAIDALKAKKDYTGFDVKTAVADGETNITVTIEAKDGFTTITTEFTVVAEKDEELVSKDDLNQTINSVDRLVESDYTEDSWSTMQTALFTAKNIMQDNDATQAEVDNANDTLSDAIDGLVRNDEGGGNNESLSTLSN